MHIPGETAVAAGSNGSDRYLEKLAVSLERIESLWEKLLFVKWDLQALGVMHRLVQGFATGARVLARDEVFVRAQELAAQVTVALDQGGDAGPALRNRIGARLNSVRKALTRAARGRQIDPDPRIDRARAGARDLAVRILFLQCNADIDDALVVDLRRHGYDVHTVADSDSLQAAHSETSPQIIVAEVSSDDEAFGGVQAINRLRSDPEFSIPVIFVSSRGDLEARLQSIRGGGDGYFVRPVDTNELCKKIDLLAEREVADPYRVLVVDDHGNPESGESKSALTQAGMTVEVLDAPAQLLQRLDEFQPDALILGIKLGEFNGVELVQLVRQESRYADLPVIFLSSEEDAGSRSAALRQGGDALLFRPVPGEHLVAAVMGRVRRARELVQRLRHLRCEDALTGLHNRRFFELAAERAFVAGDEPGTHTAVVFLQLDDFHGVRDQVGLIATDLLLQDIARLLSGRLRTGETLARFGESAFALLICNGSLSGMEAAGRSLCAVVSEELYAVEDQTLSLTCSVGISALADTPISAEQWIANAAMVSDLAASRGGNRVHVYNPLEDNEPEPRCRGRYEHLVREALDNDLFRLVFQPIASLRGDRAEKFETFVRMTDAAGIEIMPAEFLPVARQAGLEGRVDQWVVAESIRVIADYRALGRNIVLFVKVTEAFMAIDGAVQWVEEQLNAHSVEGSSIVFELDEREIATNLAVASGFATAVRKLRCGVALEHFGVHLDSSNMLMHIPAEHVKIDGSFTHELGSTPGNQDSIRAMVQRVSAVGILTIAELVEDAASLVALLDTGVHYVQGNFLQEPDEYLVFDFDAELYGVD